MTISRSFVVLIGLCILFLSCRRSPADHFPLTEGWEFKHPDSSTWREATVPGVVHLDLYNHGQIEDPFFGENEQKQAWIGETDWTYRISFPGDPFLKRKHTELVFEGLDTYSDVYLNDSLLLRTDNQFRTWTVDISGHLRKSNVLFIRFFAPEPIEKKKSSEHPYPLPDDRGFTRKAPYQYGWDWGPKFLTMGVWKPCYIMAWDDFRIRSVRMVPQLVSDTLARYSAVLEILSDKNQEVIIRHRLEDEETVETNLHLREGLNRLPVSIRIPDPSLWWPRGMGEQVLYNLHVEVQSNKCTDEAKVRFGIREAELVREPDPVGETFYFKINEKPVFARGANYVPMDNFPSRIPETAYQKLIESSVEGNMNMLRVWGGGIYETDLFYDLCDEYGLMVWQDFMFACNLYPADPRFLENVRSEAEEQVTRISNHPSVVLWCGNNEVDEGLINWGWQEALGYSTEDSIEAWQDYRRLFHALLPAVVDSLAPDHAYIPSSPQIGWGHEEALFSGDMHYWGVWWGEEPFEVYTSKVGRFMSEYGFQGFPPPATLDSVLQPEQKHLDNPALLNHQKHPRGMELIRTYMERDFPVPEDFFRYAYVSQLVQAYGMKIAIEAHRRAKPVCMGTLYWQLNDSWPVISWSGLDYYGRWKALHYTAKKAYENVLVSFQQDQNRLGVFVISELQEGIPVTVEIRLSDVDGTLLRTHVYEETLRSDSVVVIFSEPFSVPEPARQFVYGTVKQGDTILANNTHYFVSPKDLMLPVPEISIRRKVTDNILYIGLESPVLVKDVYLYTRQEGHFSDNYFDLLPGVPVEVQFSPASGKIEEDADVELLHLGEVLQKN